MHLRQLGQQSEDSRFEVYVYPLRECMKSRSEEIIKQLNRLINDRNLAMPVRNKIRDAVQHIKKLQDAQAASKSETELRA